MNSSYSVFNEHSLNFFVKLYSYLITNQIPVKPNDLSPTSLDRKWWAWVDSNHRPRAYQARALTSWAMSPYGIELGDRIPVWWRWWDSNPWPPACRAGALPTELHPHLVCCGSFSLVSMIILPVSNPSLKIEQQTLRTSDPISKPSCLAYCSSP